MVDRTQDIVAVAVKLEMRADEMFVGRWPNPAHRSLDELAEARAQREELVEKIRVLPSHERRQLLSDLIAALEEAPR